MRLAERQSWCILRKMNDRTLLSLCMDLFLLICFRFFSYENFLSGVGWREKQKQNNNKHSSLLPASRVILFYTLGYSTHNVLLFLKVADALHGCHRNELLSFTHTFPLLTHKTPSNFSIKHTHTSADTQHLPSCQTTEETEDSFTPTEQSLAHHTDILRAPPFSRTDGVLKR